MPILILSVCVIPSRALATTYKGELISKNLLILFYYLHIPKILCIFAAEIILKVGSKISCLDFGFIFEDNRRTSERRAELARAILSEEEEDVVKLEVNEGA